MLGLTCQISGQYQGSLRYIAEMSHSVSPRLTVYRSGAVSAMGTDMERAESAWASAGPGRATPEPMPAPATAAASTTARTQPRGFCDVDDSGRR